MNTAMRNMSICCAMLLICSIVQAAEPPSWDPRVGVFSSDFPYTSKFIEIKGHKLHYIDEGKGDTFLFLHGNPTSSYLWRNVMRYVKPAGRIIALDNIGFGKSDKPKDLDYTFQTHYEYVDGFINAMGLKDIIPVVHDWGSVLGLHYAVNNEENVKGIVMMEALIPPAVPMAALKAGNPVGDMMRQLRTPDQGKKLVIEQNFFIEGIMLNSTFTRTMTEEEKNAYRAPFVDPSTRFPIYVWPNELPIAGEPARNVTVVVAVGEWLKKSSTPKLLQYASPGSIVSPVVAQWMVENYRNIEMQFVGYGGHYIQEDNPEAIGRGIVDWHRRNFR